MSIRILPDHHYVEIAAFGLDQGIFNDQAAADSFAMALRAINIARFRTRYPKIDARALPGGLKTETARRWHGGIVAQRIETLRYQLVEDGVEPQQEFVILDRLYDLAIADSGGVVTPDRWVPP